MKNDKLGNSGHLVDMMSHILEKKPTQLELEKRKDSYCAYLLDVDFERDCKSCNLVNYGRDCRNNEVSNTERRLCPFCGYKVVRAGFTSGRPRQQIWQCANPALDDTANWVCRKRTTKTGAPQR